MRVRVPQFNETLHRDNLSGKNLFVQTRKMQFLPFLMKIKKKKDKNAEVEKKGQVKKQN